MCVKYTTITLYKYLFVWTQIQSGRFKNLFKNKIFIKVKIAKKTADKKLKKLPLW